MQDLVTSGLSIPTLPDVAARIKRLIEDPHSEKSDFETVIGEDPPLAARALQIANGAYYGMPGRCLSIEQATGVLGIQMLRKIVSQVTAFHSFEDLTGKWGSTVEDIWKSSIRTAQVCSHVARRSTGVLNPADCYTIGLLHDIGKIVMTEGLRSDYLEAIEAARKLGKPLSAVEKRRFGFDHCEVGAAVSARRQLPKEMCAAIQNHHGPKKKAFDEPLSAIVFVADLVVQQAAQNNELGIRSIFDAETMSALRIRPSDVDDIVWFAITGEGEKVEQGWYGDPWED